MLKLGVVSVYLNYNAKTLNLHTYNVAAATAAAAAQRFDQLYDFPII